MYVHRHIMTFFVSNKVLTGIKNLTIYYCSEKCRDFMDNNIIEQYKNYFCYKGCLCQQKYVIHAINKDNVSFNPTEGSICCQYLANILGRLLCDNGLITSYAIKSEQKYVKLMYRLYNDRSRDTINYLDEERKKYKHNIATEIIKNDIILVRRDMSNLNKEVSKIKDDVQEIKTIIGDFMNIFKISNNIE